MIYTYVCPRCKNEFERDIRLQDAVKGKHLNVHCPKCGGHSRKLINKPNIHYKGSGFTLTKSEK